MKTKQEIKEETIDMAIQAGFVDYELDDGTTNAFDKRYEAFAKLVAEKAFQDGYSIGEAAGFKQAIKLERVRGEA